MEEETHKHLEEFETAAGFTLDDDLRDFITTLHQNYTIEKPIIIYGTAENSSWVVIRALCYLLATKRRTLPFRILLIC